MPLLPTVNVTTQQAQRCLAAWGDPVAYRNWLIAQVRNYVLASERAADEDEIRDVVTARRNGRTDPMSGVDPTTG